MCEHKIQRNQARFYVFHFVLLASSEILSLDGLVDLPSEKMVDALTRPISAICSVFALQKLPNEGMGYVWFFERVGSS